MNVLGELEREIQRVLDSVAKDGAYTTGHVLLIEAIIGRKIAEVQNGIKELLGIRECFCEH